MPAVTLRFARPEDDAQIKALEARVEPYRPEDRPSVEAMLARGRSAEQDTRRWTPIPSGPEQSGPGYLAFWVARLPGELGEERIVGMVGVGQLNPWMMLRDLPYAAALRQRQDFIELQHLRVDPDVRGAGIGLSLCQAVINWAREQGYKMLLVNTTTPQLPARGLYQKLGFVEKSVSFVGLYELVWMELGL